jgi:hypothetical protein
VHHLEPTLGLVRCLLVLSPFSSSPLRYPRVSTICGSFPLQQRLVFLPLARRPSAFNTLVPPVSSLLPSYSSLASSKPSQRVYVALVIPPTHPSSTSRIVCHSPSSPTPRSVSPRTTRLRRCLLALCIILSSSCTGRCISKRAPVTLVGPLSSLSPLPYLPARLQTTPHLVYPKLSLYSRPTD